MSSRQLDMSRWRTVSLPTARVRIAGLRTASLPTARVRIAGLRTASLGTAIAAAGAAVALATCASPEASAQSASAPASPVFAATSSTIVPSLSPDRLGAKAALTVTISYTGGQFGVPTPVRRSILRFPAGLSLDLPSLRSCPSARLLARGPSTCPAQSEIGGGHALAEAHEGTENISENATLWAFLGPPQNLQPTFEILAQGYTPIDKRVVLNGTVLPASAPYGEALSIAIPPIPTLAFEPDASVVVFSLTIGTSGRHTRHDANAVLVPSSCPVDGFPFAAEFTYADGSSGSSVATVPCPR